MTESQKSGLATLKAAVRAASARPGVAAPVVVSQSHQDRVIAEMASRYPVELLHQETERYRKDLESTGGQWREGAFRRRVGEAYDNQIRGVK